jgi:hypothetical protein
MVLPSALSGRPGNAHHHGLAGAVDIGIQDAHAGPFGGQGQGQVDRGGALADAALSRGHGDDVLHTRQQLHPALHGVRGDLGGDLHADIADTRHRARGGHQGLAQRGMLALAGVAQLDLEGHVAVFDAQALQLTRRHVVFARVGVDDGFQRFGQRRFCDGGGHGPDCSKGHRGPVAGR